MSGLTGLGVYLLTRGGHDTLLLGVLRYLVKLTEPVTADPDLLPGWWTGDGPELRPSPRWPGPRQPRYGTRYLRSARLHGDLHAAGLAVPGQARAIRSICTTLDQWCLGTGERLWWPELLSRDEWRTRIPRRHGPGRPSWCYGTPGIARARQLAALALGDALLQHRAEMALAACVTDERQLAQLTDASLCHGWAGLVRAVQRAATDAGPNSGLGRPCPGCTPGCATTSSSRGRPFRPDGRRRRRPSHATRRGRQHRTDTSLGRLPAPGRVTRAQRPSTPTSHH
ncbi:lanthionine synthetase LanC family protein [Streptomyces sp. M10(2022)]